MTRDIIDDGTQILRRDHLGQWWKVVVQCARCGKCCMDVPPNWPWWDEDRGGCKHLVEEHEDFYRCGIGGKGKSWRPIRCVPHSPFSNAEYCQIKMEKISLDEAMEIIRTT